MSDSVEIKSSPGVKCRSTLSSYELKLPCVVEVVGGDSKYGYLKSVFKRYRRLRGRLGRAVGSQ